MAARGGAAGGQILHTTKKFPCTAMPNLLHVSRIVLGVCHLAIQQTVGEPVQCRPMGVKLVGPQGPAGPCIAFIPQVCQPENLRHRGGPAPSPLDQVNSLCGKVIESGTWGMFSICANGRKPSPHCFEIDSLLQLLPHPAFWGDLLQGSAWFHISPRCWDLENFNISSIISSNYIPEGSKRSPCANGRRV